MINKFCAPVAIYEKNLLSNEMIDSGSIIDKALDSLDRLPVDSPTSGHRSAVIGHGLHAVVNHHGKHYCVDMRVVGQYTEHARAVFATKQIAERMAAEINNTTSGYVLKIGKNGFKI